MKKYISIIIILLMSNNIFAREQISNLVTPVSYFIDHISQLKKIKSNLIKYKQSSLVGVSGMGKTQIARMYAYDKDNKADYDIIWFIDCNLDIDGQLVNLAKAINIKANTAVVSENINVVRKELMTYLTSKNRWLLVFDNLKIGQNKKVANFINWEHNGNILFCSQDSESLPNIVKISAFEEKESKMLVENILESNNPESIEFLVQEFKGYPILMVQGSQILNQVQGLSLNEYKKKIQEADDKIKLNITLAISELSPSAQKLLNEIALINNQSFSKEFLSSITSDKDHLDDDIYNISKFALITNIEPNENNPIFEMHDVIVEKILQINENDNKENLYQLITNLLNTIPKSLIKGNIFRKNKTVLDNIEIITQNAENYNISIYKILELKLNLLIQYVTACDLTRSKILVDWFDKNEKENNFKLLMMDNDEKGAYATYLGRIGWYYSKNSESREAIEYFMKAKKVFEGVKEYGTSKSNIVFGLVISNVQLGNLKEAEANIQIMQDMFNQNLIDKTDAATLDYAKAHLFLAQGKYEEALKQINATIDACIDNGMKPQDVFLTGLYLLKIDILNNLKNYNDALPLLEEVYNMKKPKEKEEYPIFGRIYTQMSIVKLGLGNNNEALEYAKKAVEAFLKDPNRSNKDVAASPDIYLAKAFVAEGNAFASINKNEDAITAYATAENIYWNNYRENMKNVDAISIMYLNAAKASCHVPLKSFYKNFRDHHIEKFGEQHPRSIEILKLNCH
ncbi:tetratricopeptide repeat protein [Rickettsia bellii]|uniref:Tetratricopeptide repeat family protein n=3 Tax=Rickettsia bellii TaxID=33990 RepID=Q1RK46_RICBR|nr:tetratricopeptide repeat protein [Rickettsia bellii]ABE04268.1 unknown [Rickettsia bellii RML369-C]